jgi:hypothetical protein
MKESSKQSAWQVAILENVLETSKSLGNTLQIGYGSALPLEVIGLLDFTHYTIITENQNIPLTIEKRSSVTLSKESWQEMLDKCDLFDTIIFNGLNFEKTTILQEEKGKGLLLMKEASRVLSSVNESLPHLTTIQYAIEDLTSFFDEVKSSGCETLSRFANELKSNRQISDESYKLLQKKYALIDSAASTIARREIDPISACLFSSLTGPLKQGGRFIAICPDCISKFEDPLFFEKVITDPNYNFSESTLSYQNGSDPSCEVLVYVVEKVGIAK